MSDNSKSRDAFARANQRITNPDGSPLRDKDNAAPTPRPANIRSNNPLLAPGGAMGIRPTQNRTPLKATRPGVSVEQTLFGDDARYTDGKILTMPGYSFMIRVTDAPSPKALGGGTIEQLVLRKDDRPVAIYNRGWAREPTTPEHKEAILRIRNGLGDRPQKEFKGFSQTKGQDPEMTR